MKDIKEELVAAFCVSMLFMGIGCKEEEEVVEKSFEGVTVRVLAYDFLKYKPMLDYVGDIKDIFGITFESDRVPSGAMQDKMWVELGSGSGEHDIVYLSSSWKGEMITKDYIISLNEYIEKYDLNLDGWDYRKPRKPQEYRLKC